jgi:hypothetical protein
MALACTIWQLKSAAGGIHPGSEAELPRAIAISLDCPIPPFIPAVSV